MAAQIAGLDYYELDFSANGTLTSDGGLLAATAAGGIQDLYLLSHGWNSTPASARSLYQAVFTLLAGMIPGEIGHSAAVGIIWPSVVFPDDDPATAPPQPSTGQQLAAALSPAFPQQPGNLATLGQLLDTQPPDAARLDQFHSLAAGLVTTPPLAAEDAGQQASVEGATAAVLGHAAAMSADPASSAQGILDPFSTLWRGAREVLRDMSYYEMKNRAGVIGRAGLGPLLGRLAAADPGLRVHLMGHSFGARLVAYALSGLPPAAAGANSPVRCLLLIQGAFSHFSFADPVPCVAVSGPGALAAFARNVNGPLLATFSAADRALGWWYPAASMLAQQNAESVADLSYEWGAMGHDGYQQSPPGTTVKLAAPGTAYHFQPGGFYLLDANAVIRADQSAFSGAHSDIRHAQVIWPLISAGR
ncbi:MAG TPA: hypothetical protein VN597_07895 [Streptosporangiaceae bacterium]|nr:hypothetical protein [Streptosporangiaceae bacterium]